MAYVALKPCCFAGQRFRIGEIVPDELIHPGAVQNLLKMQVIAVGEAESGTTLDTVVIPNPTFSIIVSTEEGETTVTPTDDGIQDVFNVLIGKATAAEPIIKSMTDADALLLLYLSDSRKAVKAAAEARVKELSAGEESAGEE